MQLIDENIIDFKNIPPRHGLTNGESVVIYKLPGESENLIGHYTFLTSNCLYETHHYQLSTNGKYLNEGE